MSCQTLPLVSVLIPMYRVEQYIEECLSSVLSQSYPHIEIILVNDCSPDNSKGVAERFLNENNQKNYSISLIDHEENQGLAGARITALKEAKGEFLFFLDSDDYWLSDKLVEESVRCMQRQDADVVIFNYVELFRRSNRKSSIPHIEKSKDLVRAYLDGTSPAYLWNKCFRRDLFLQYANLWELGNNMWEDMQNVPPYILHCKKIAYIEDCFVAYRRTNETALTLSPSAKSVQDQKRVVAFLDSYLAENAPDDYDFYKEGIANAYNWIDIGLVCQSKYRVMCEVMSSRGVELALYTEQMQGLSKYFLRFAFLFYRWHLAPISFCLLWMKRKLQALR